MVGGAWWATVHGVTESDMTEQTLIAIFISCLSTQRFKGVLTLTGKFKHRDAVHKYC